jgi:UDP-glucose 4-epimerase
MKPVAVVTGGAGFIGSHVTDHLTAIGANVTVVDDLSVGTRDNLRDAEAAGATFAQGDIRDAEAMRRILDGSSMVIHMACDNLRASLGAPMHTHDVNATGTLVTALAAVESGVERFVYVSSSEAYGSAVSTPMDEDHPLRPTTVYGASKAAGELYTQGVMRTYGLETIVVRPFNSYGPREHATGTSAEVIPKFVTRLLAGEPPVIFGDGSAMRDFTWVEETAAGIVQASLCDDLVGEAVNIAYGEGVVIKEIAELLVEMLDGAEVGIQYDEPRPGDVAVHFADNRKAKRVVGFTANVAIREGLERYVNWMRETGASEVRQHGVPIRNW